MDIVASAEEAAFMSAWRAEGLLSQWLAFCLILTTRSLSLQHISRKEKKTHMNPTVAAFLSFVGGFVAIGLSITAVISYMARNRNLALADLPESRVRVAVLFLSFVLVLCEAGIVVASLVFHSRNKEKL